MAARKQSMVPSESRRKSIYDRKASIDSRKGGDRRLSVDRRSGADVPYVGRRGSVVSERRMSMAGSLRGELTSADGKQRGGAANVRYENTYQLEPVQVFPIHKAKKLAAEVLGSSLKDMTYNREDCTRQAKILADQIKQRVKALEVPRYKIVAIVSIGQIQDTHPSLSFTSRCIWNDKCDSFAEATYKNRVLYAVALVYALYAD